MRWLRVALRNRLRRHALDQELHEELRATVDLLTAEKIRAGASPEAARRSAQAELGGLESIKQAVRESRRGAFVDVLTGDLRYAIRVLRRSPLFTLSAAGSLALGIGATTAIFSVVDGLLLSAAPGVAEPQRLVDVVRRDPTSGPGVELMSYPDLLDLRAGTTTLEEAFGFQLAPVPTSLRTAGGVTAVNSVLVTNNYFRALGVRATVGRVLDARDSDRPAASPVAVLNYAFWMRRFGGTPGTIGQTVWLNDVPVTVVGVAAQDFQGLSVVAPDLWLPVGMITAQSPESQGRELSERIPWLALGARLKADVSRGQASAEVAVIGARVQQTASPRLTGPAPLPGARERRPRDLVWSVERATPIPFGVRVLAAGFSGLLMAIVSTLLVIACANVAGVLLARAAVRRREIAVRNAMGATRARLVRQLLTETIVLFLIGACGGLWLSRVLAGLLLRVLPAFPVSLNVSVPLDGTVVSFALLVSLVGAILSGLAPALHGARANVSLVLKNDEQGPADRHRLRQAFVVTQVACSLVLVVVAGLLVRGFDTLSTTQRGFDARDVDVLSLDLSLARHRPEDGVGVVQRLVEQARLIPGVTGVSIADRVPGGGGRRYGTLSTATESQSTGAPEPGFNWSLTGPGYFQVLGIRMIAGRDFTPDDSAETEPVIVLGARAAAALWPGQDAVGRHLYMTPVIPSQDRQTRVARVVGIVAEASDNARSLAVYLPWTQWYVPTVTIITKRMPDRPSVVASLQATVVSVDPKLPVLSARSLEGMGDGPIETQLRMAASVAGSVGVIGILLAAVGIYGVAAYLVTQRTREIGIRLSLGATTAEIVGLVLREGMRLVVVGATIGLSLGVAAGRVLAGRQYGIPQFDPGVMAFSTLLFVAIGLAACYVPVRRAARIRVIEALRYE
jgi:putative ABC transport system permease protein